MKKYFFLILSSSGGAGHIRAAEALLEAVKESELPVHARHYDCLDFTSKVFKQLYAQSYLAMVNRLPELWGYLYSEAERKPYTKKGLLRVFDHFNYQRYIRTLRQLKPDAIICTHFLPFISVSERAREAHIDAPFFAATTDFDVHQLWIDPLVSRYYVYHEESAWQLTAKGVPRDKIMVAGIPVGSRFARRTSQRTARQKLGIPTNRFTLLLLSGGFGVGRIEGIAHSAAELLGSFPRKAFNLLVVCGRNESVKSGLEKQRFPSNVHLSVYGYVNNVEELMDASDLLVSKSGGLTSAEAMAKRLPMIVVDPIPGQETRNASIIVERGAGLFALDLHNLQFKLKKIIESPAVLRTLRMSTEALAKPHAATDIVADVYRQLIHHQYSSSMVRVS